MESIVYYSVKSFGWLVRQLPAGMALGVGRFFGSCAYLFDLKHRAQVYANLKTAFAGQKKPSEIRQIAHRCFQNFGQNLIEMFRLPLLTTDLFKSYVQVDGRENIEKALGQNKGVILLAMHFGSWEMASLTCAMLGHPYKVIVKPQKKYSRLDDLLNSYRECGGSVVLERGLGMRGFINALKQNNIVGMVVDQGGRDGVLVPFFGRQASMSSGAIRMGLKMGVPICFAVIIRGQGPHHRLVIQPSLQLEKTGDLEADVAANLKTVAQTMENYVSENPQEYMWFYKIWKYSSQASVLILDDGRTGHLRQSQAAAHSLAEALKGRGIELVEQVVPVVFKSPALARTFSLLSLFSNVYLQGRISFMKWFLTRECYDRLAAIHSDFIISCGSSTAAVNCVLATEQQAKSIVILKPGLIGLKRFDLAILPQHDFRSRKRPPANVVICRGAPNLVSPEYLQENADGLLRRFSHLKIRDKHTIGLLLGGDTKTRVLSETGVKMVIHQLKEVAVEINAEILVTTSRRTSPRVESLVMRELKRSELCPLAIIANNNNVPEAVGGILALSDMVVVSGDSISMISEAASSGKKTVVFPLDNRSAISAQDSKYTKFINHLNGKGYILSSDLKSIKTSVYGLMKNKIQVRQLNDRKRISKGMQRII